MRESTTRELTKDELQQEREAAATRAVQKALDDVPENMDALAAVQIGLVTARHIAANRMASAGWELRKISAALGHQSVSTTEQYLRSLKDDELDEDHMGLF